jgi:hypothetical protein
MMRTIKIFICFLFLALISCKKELIEKIPFQKPKIKYELAIEGGVTSLSTTQFIKISKPSFSISDTTTSVNDAQVFINDVPLTITNTDGIYSADLIDNKRYNEAYYLKVIYHGLTYKAVDTLKKVDPIVPSELNIILQNNNSNNNSNNTFISIPKHIFNSGKASKIFYQLPNKDQWSSSSFKPSSYYAYIHFYAPPYGLSPILEKRTDYAIKPTDSITVYKFSVSLNYEKFLYSVFQETDWKSLFSSTPGEIKGNISGNALGYFNCSDGISQKIEVNSLIK